MAEEYFFEPARGHGLAHDPLNSIIAPRPIGWISSVSDTGLVNLAPYSFFNLFNYKPPIIGLTCIQNARGFLPLAELLLTVTAA